MYHETGFANNKLIVNSMCLCGLTEFLDDIV